MSYNLPSKFFHLLSSVRNPKNMFLGDTLTTAGIYPLNYSQKLKNTQKKQATAAKTSWTTLLA